MRYWSFRKVSIGMFAVALGVIYALVVLASQGVRGGMVLPSTGNGMVDFLLFAVFFAAVLALCAVILECVRQKVSK